MKLAWRKTKECNFDINFRTYTFCVKSTAVYFGYLIDEKFKKILKTQ